LRDELSKLSQVTEEGYMDKILEPVITSKGTSETAHVSIQKIIVPIDLSERSENTASYAIALAKSFQASLIFVHIFPPELITEFTIADVSLGYTRERDAAKEKLISFGNEMGRIYPRCETQFRIGAVAEEVRRAVLEWNADLIVTASYNPGFLGHLFGLERAPQIVKSAPCPVVVYHETQGVPIDNNCGLELRED
jgi:nucleotide-binding universal stress UspA family protein